MGVLFELSQPQACAWFKRLTPPVSMVLGRELLLPARRSADLDVLLTEVPALRLSILDGVDRPIRRTKDKQRKKDDYSGKKKAHRQKNLLVSSHERRVVYLGPTSPGCMHDKKLADESGLRFPADALVLKDTGSGPGVGMAHCLCRHGENLRLADKSSQLFGAMLFRYSAVLSSDSGFAADAALCSSHCDHHKAIKTVNASNKLASTHRRFFAERGRNRS